ncbi:MAG: ABC transporter ATP-binding protein [Clostridia bacterium]|nr:ABC transporter ATP-binding protein [Clostridia bacterium]
MSGLFSLKDARISYGKTEIVHGVDIDIAPGEFCALLGLNGSGKTTILHGCCGFLPVEGSFTVADTDCRGLNEKKRARLISFIPQICSLQGGRTALEVVLMGFNSQLRLLESPLAEHKRAALAAMKRLNCAEFAEKDFGALSQGQRQIVILARCIVQDSPVMLMDEPDSALDFLNRHMVLAKIRELIKEENKAGLITLHDPNFAMAYCDRLLLLRQGSIVEELDMRRAGAEEVREKLSLIYGDIGLLQNGSSFLMGKAL